MALIWVFALLNVWVVGFALWAANDIRRFLDRNPRIGSGKSLDEYASLARRNMLASILQGAVLLTTIVLGILIILRFGLTGLLISLSGNAVTFVFGRHVGKYEKRAKALRADSPELEELQARITRSWGRRLLPDF